MIKINLPSSDIEINIDYDVRDDNVIYSAAYVGDIEFQAEKLFLANGLALSDYFNMKLQENASALLIGE